MDEKIKKRIEDMIHKNKIFIFMKGSPDAPECGFSMKVANILKDLHVEFGYFNIFEDEEIRQGVKEYANWPTIPQVYINGKFVGGADIMEQLYNSGKLKKLIEE
ncbi:Grx4 family monothiol glutaredoxin [Candidatus Woesearchaeota archaeon]|nr:Grx4 family monothiol glutaredoxin [Candidatus Woesearchaeota archaeon]